MFMFDFLYVIFVDKHLLIEEDAKRGNQRRNIVEKDKKKDGKTDTKQRRRRGRIEAI